MHLTRLPLATGLALALGLAGLLAAGPTRAEDGAGTRSPLTLGSGAREMGMGRTGVALAEGPEALYWNVSRLTHTDRAEFSLFRTQLFADGVTYHAGFLSYPTLSLGSFALGYQRMGIDGIERRDDRNFVDGEFGSSETHFTLGYATRPGRWPVGVGGAIRLQQQKVDAAQATGVGFDLGLHWDRSLGATPGQELVLGLAAQNLVEPKLRLDQEEVTDPFTWRLGAAFVRAIETERLQWALATELELPQRGDRRWGVGMEVGLDRMIQLRGGVDDGHATFGLGLASYGVSFDYAMLDGQDLGRSDRFSLSVSFGPSTQERRDAQLRHREEEVRDQLENLLNAREQQALANARRDADLAFDEQRWADASELYRRVLLVEPEDTHATARLDATQRERQLDEADQTLERGEAARAAALYQAVLDRWADDPEATAGLAEARARLQRSEDQQRQLSDLFRDALDLFAKSDFVGTVRVLDELLRLQPDHELAVELRDRADSMRGESGDRLLREARSLGGQQRWDGAFGRLERARLVVPERGDEISRLRQQLTQRRDEIAREAQLQAERERQLARERQARNAPKTPAKRTLSPERQAQLMAAYQEGLGAFQVGDFDRATRVWQEIWTEAPDFQDVADHLVKAYLLQGIQFYGKGDYAAAVDRCRRVLEIDAANAKAQRYLARIEEERQELQQIRGD